MDAESHAGPSAGSATRWRHVPWSVPYGRRVAGWKALPLALLYGALIFSLAGGQTIGIEGFSSAIAILGLPIVASYVLAAVAAVGYGCYVLATAHLPRKKPVAPFIAGLVGNPVARRWYGLAYVITPLIAWGAPFAFRPTASTDYFAALWLAAPLAAVGCILLARGYSNRDVKRAVLADRAPRYEMSPDGTWWRKGNDWASVGDRVWWNGDAWISAGAEAPHDALRSPDGNYWWTGASWCAMPPTPKRAKNAPRASATSF